MRIAITPLKRGWAVISQQSQNSHGVYKTKREAQHAARTMARERGGEVVIRGRDGRIQGVDTFSLARCGAAQLSAVEGVRLSEDVVSDINALDGQEMSDDERRNRLLSKYGRV
ncbi:MAG: hypothetical protein A49_19630 [Methyloceanibacter sp.]|nr:MAG: hypothetical protein A49_19630 [Methyloceanibacter sp.]